MPEDSLPSAKNCNPTGAELSASAAAKEVNVKRAIMLAAALAALAYSGASAEQPSLVNVRDFGAVGDGVTDDTAAFQAAMKAVAERGGTASVPVGDYLIKTHLVVPSKVTLEGVWKIPTAFTQRHGSTLLAVEGAGSEDGPPFITLQPNATIKGLTIFYPNQKPEAIQKYPWCVACAGGDNSSIVDCLLVNPYNGVDFGSKPSGRHYIRNLYGQPLRRGIFVDKCYDIGRIENVHFWPFWYWREGSEFAKWWTKNGEAFIFARSDWEYVFNTFCFGYGIGYRFVKSKDGAMNGNLLGIGADAADIAVLVEEAQVPGLLITNGEFVALYGERLTEVVVKATNTGVVQFQNCSFWGPARQIASIAGTGTVSFNGCNFVHWDPAGKKLPIIEAFGGNLLVNGCNFVSQSPQVALRGRTESAVIVGNRMDGPLVIANPAKANAQIGLNAAKRPPAPPKVEKGAVVVDDADGFPAVILAGEWKIAENAPNTRFGFHLGTRWAHKGGGECRAVFTPNVPKTGRYAVYAFFGPDPMKDHASDAPVEVRSADGVRGAKVNLRPLNGEWVKLGTFRFRAGRAGSVVFTNKANGNVLADAVKLVRVK